jgi:hypothetical protein
MADARGLDLDQHLTGAGPVQVNLFDHQGLTGTIGDSSATFHSFNPHGISSRIGGQRRADKILHLVIVAKL